MNLAPEAALLFVLEWARTQGYGKPQNSHSPEILLCQKDSGLAKGLHDECCLNCRPEDKLREPNKKFSINHKKNIFYKFENYSKWMWCRWKMNCHFETIFWKEFTNVHTSSSGARLEVLINEAASVLHAPHSPPLPRSMPCKTNTALYVKTYKQK